MGRGDFFELFVYIVPRNKAQDMGTNNEDYLCRFWIGEPFVLNITWLSVGKFLHLCGE